MGKPLIGGSVVNINLLCNSGASHHNAPPSETRALGVSKAVRLNVTSAMCVCLGVGGGWRAFEIYHTFI